MTVPVDGDVTSQVILDAARTRLLTDGYAGLSTRKVAQEAGVPLSQVHYHFGSKGGMVLALLRSREPAPARPPGRDVRRGRRPVAAVRAGVRLPRGRPRVGLRPRAPGDDRRRVVQPRDRRRARGRCWPAGTSCSTTVATEAAARFGGLGPFSPAEAAALIVNAFIGAEALLLLGFDRHQMPIRASLRRIGELIRAAEERSAIDGRPRSMRAIEPCGPATSSATVCGCTGRSSATASRRSPCCRRGRSSTRATGSSRCPTSPATTG